MKAEIRDLFQSASQLPSEDRSAFLMEVCEDPVLRAEVESLLQYATGGESFFDTPVRETASSLRAETELAPGDPLGPWKIVRQIGHGGMGTVYLAERSDGAYRQEVAAKVLQNRHATLLQDRFEQERQILALLNHPNIARILDAGQAPSGLPWFVMEYVPGQKIDDHCEQQNLTIRARLELFIKVCDAVRHAHQSLVVHRDLKPANILVSADGEPKLLDFGIAKILDPGNLNTATTRLLTPEYASPEQIRGEPITAATDIYSLGAVLYRILTGKAPHSLDEIAPLDAARIVTERTVAPASTVRAGIPRDVESILQKALHKDSARRYQSVEQFAQDIQAYLQGRPVVARPDRFGYRARRFVKRNAIVVTLCALAAASLIAGAVISGHQARRAERRFQQVRQLANVFLFDFDRAIENVPGTLEARKLVVATAQKYLEQLAADSQDDAGLQREIATSWERLSRVHFDLLAGNGDEAEIEYLRKAWEIRRSLRDGESRDPEIRSRYIALTSRLGDRYKAMRNAAEAAKWDEEAVRLASVWVEAEPRSLEALDAARAAFTRQALRLETAGQATRAREVSQKAVGFAELAFHIAPGNDDIALNFVATRNNLGTILIDLRDAPAALAQSMSAAVLGETLYRKDPQNRRWRREYQNALGNAGVAHMVMAESDASHNAPAIDYLRCVHVLAVEAAREDRKNARAQDDLIVHKQRLALALVQARRYDEAASLYQESIRAARELVAVSPRDRHLWFLVVSSEFNYGKMRLDQGRTAEAERVLLSANSAFERALALDPSDAMLLAGRVAQLHHLAIAAGKLGRREDAKERIAQSVDVLSSMLSRDPSAKAFIDQFSDIVALAQGLGVPTAHLPVSTN